MSLVFAVAIAPYLIWLKGFSPWLVLLGGPWIALALPDRHAIEASVEAMQKREDERRAQRSSGDGPYRRGP